MLITRGVVLAATAGLLLNIVSSKAPARVPTLAWIALLVLCLVADVVFQVRARPETEQVEGSDRALDLATESLAKAARKQWIDEVRRIRQNSGSKRLPMSWRPANPDLFSSFERVVAIGADIPDRDRSDADDWLTSVAALKGSELELGRMWLERVPSRRLVLLGDAGSGKTELLYQIMKSLLGREDPGQKIPVLVPAASWDPQDTRFSNWIIDWLSTNYPFLKARAPGPNAATLAEELLDRRRLAIVVDGLDELPPDLARTAVNRLSDELGPGQPLLLSSRPEPFRAAVADRPIDGAVGVVLDGQDPTRVLAHLRDRSRDEPRRWDELAVAVERFEPVATVLRTPLMVMLADAIYNDPERNTSKPGPGELLAYTNPDAIEDRLLDGFVELRYGGARARPWRFGDVRHWLGYLASARERAGRADSINLAWWDLPVPPPGVRSRRFITHVATPVLAMIWTAISAAVMYSLILNDPNRGLTNAARISLAVVATYAALLYLSRSYQAALLAVLGAYIAGIMSGSYDHAIVAGLAAGICWPQTRLVRFGRWHALAVGAAAAAAPVLVRLADTLSPLNPQITLLQGFAGGFADGWVNRWDPDWNGFVGILAIVTSVVWVAMRRSSPSGTAADRPLRLLNRWTFPTGSSLVDASIVGVLVMALGFFADGHQDHVSQGWMLAPADGFAIGYLVWFLSSWSRRQSAGSGESRTPQLVHQDAQPTGTIGRLWITRERPRMVAVLAATAAGLVNLLAFTGRTDVQRPWANALADAIVLGLLTWYLVGPPQAVPDASDGENRDARGRSLRLLEVLRVAWPALLLGPLVGGLVALSVGAPGAAYGIAAFAIVLFHRYRHSALWHRRKPDAELTGYRGPGLWVVRAEEAGLFVTVAVGIVAGFAYALLYGVTAALAIKVSLEIYGRNRPSTGLQVSNTGLVGGVILGSMVAFGAMFSEISTEWAVPIGITSAAAAVFAFGTEGIPARETQVLSPERLLALDRWAFLRTMLGLPITVGLAAGTWTMAVYGLTPGLLAGIGTTTTYGITAGVVVTTAQSRFGHYTARRFWLAADGELPWRLMAFLDDAYSRRGILRRNGAFYQFRHERLQHRLAQTHHPDDAPPRPDGSVHDKGQ
jgi:hypothetical protein